MKKIKITTEIIFILLLINTINTSGASVPWQEGDMYSYTGTSEYEYTTTKLDGELSSYLREYEKNVQEFTIDNIDETDELIDLEMIRNNGELYVNDGFSYNSTRFGTNMLNFELEGFDGKYQFFYVYLDFNYFLNPDNFDSLNKQAKLSYEEYLDEELENGTTFEDLLDEADSLDFMGAKTAADAADEFTDDRFEWTFEIDLTSVLEYPIENDVDDIKWYNYDKYIAKSHLEYDKDGVLQSYSIYVETSVTTNDYEIKLKLEEKLFSGTGAIASLTAPGFELYSVLSLFIAIPVLRRFRKEEIL